MAEKAEKTKKIKFVKSPSAAPFFLAYHIGEDAEVSEAQAKELIEAEMAIAV